MTGLKEKVFLLHNHRSNIKTSSIKERVFQRIEKTVRCPKDWSVSLVDGTLSDKLAVKHCPDCQGNWISATDYEAYVASQPPKSAESKFQAKSTTDINFVPSPGDHRAALCPECQHYLTRAKVFYKRAFYVERCTHCGGIWCDKGEWEVLEKLGLHTNVEQMFSLEWQSRVRELEYAEKERQATMEKLGSEVASKVFELAEVLEKHPNGDFGVAYLMRRFNK